jgi:hypothetical protein
LPEVEITLANKNMDRIKEEDVVAEMWRIDRKGRAHF